MTKGTVFAAIFLLSYLTAGLASGSETIRNVPRTPHGAPEGSTLEDIGRAIQQVAGEQKWYGGVEGDGLIVVSTTIRTHRATVAIGYDAEAFWIDYRDSSNLDYNPNDLVRRGPGMERPIVKKGPRIHGNYNVWVGDLAAHLGARIRSAVRSSQDPPTHVGPALIADELEKLDALRRRGVLTQSEFDAQKARLLERD
ncbi:MAG: SHOCT domain-containing protein [Myxococcota bacterium]